MPYGPRNQGRGSYKHTARQHRLQRRMAIDLAAIEGGAGAPYTFTFAAVDDDYTMLETDLLIRSTSAGVSGKTWVLHDDPLFPLLCIVHSFPVGVTLDPVGGVQIDGADTKSLATGTYRFIFDGTAWWSI